VRKTDLGRRRVGTGRVGVDGDLAEAAGVDVVDDTADVGGVDEGMWASPWPKPSTENTSMRESMQHTTTSCRAGAVGRWPWGNASA
jgi:hypothetical protein